MRRILILVSLTALMVGAVAWTVGRIRSLRKSPPAVTVRIDNQEDESNVFAGHPLILSVFLSRTAPSPALHIGGASSPWYSYIHVETLEAGKPVVLNWTVLGKPYTLDVTTDANGHLVGGRVDTSEGAVLDGSARTYSAQFAISPKDSAKLSAGRYTARAVLKPPLWPPWNWTGAIASHEVSFTILSQPAAADQELDRIADSAQFYLDGGRFEDALRMAAQLKDRAPQKTRSWILFGDALNGLGRNKDALGAYSQALELAAKANLDESPDYILMRWHEMKEKVSQTRKSP
jgi:hypothetical protein